MTFQPTVFERLLFPLNKEVYRQIQTVLDQIGENIKNFNILIRYNHLDLNIEKLQFSADFDISLDCIKNQTKLPNGNLLSLCFNKKDETFYFSVPLEYMIGKEKEDILNIESNCIYSWTLFIDKSSVNSSTNDTVKLTEDIQQYLYIGRTKKTIQKRCVSHFEDTKNNLHRPLYQALNGDYGKICKKVLCIEKAGLTLDEAKVIEEKEINERSLKMLFKNGLNMISNGNNDFDNQKAS